MAFSRSSATRWVRSATAGPVDGEPRQPADLDALVVLDLGDGGADDVHQLDGLAPLPGGGGAGEDHQALGVPAHAGGQVVEAEEVGEFVGVLGAALHGVEQGELRCSRTWLRRARLTKTSETPRAQFGLLDGGLDGGALEGVEGLADLAHLVLVVLQARDLGLHVDLFARGRGGASRWAAVRRRPRGPPGAAGVRSRMRPRPMRTESDERDEQGDQAEDAGDDGLDDDVHGDRADPVLVAVAGLVVERAEFVEHVAGGGVPALGADAPGGWPGRRRSTACSAARSGAVRGVLPEALVALALRGGQHRQVDVVEQGRAGRRGRRRRGSRRA